MESLMRAGALDRTITVERSTEIVAPSGHVSTVWQPLMTVRAEVREQTADEVATGFGETEAETLIFVVRWHPAPITTGDRITHAGRVYNIKQIAEIGRRRGWKLRAVAA